MNDDLRGEAARLLLEAYTKRVPIAPLTEQFAGMDIDDAYAIQQLQVRAWEAIGRVIKGRKVGLTSLAMQQQFGVSQPDYGILRGDMFYDSAAEIPVESFFQPRIEPEIAFVLHRDLAGPHVNVADAIAAVDFVLPALEIIDSRIADWKISITDTIADNASSGGLVLGERPTGIRDADLAAAGVVLRRHGRIVSTGTGAAVLGSPLLAVVWLANVLGARGSGLRAGDVVLPGSITAASTVQPSDSWTADFGPLGSVTAHFGSTND